jgi:hypothetical protein
MGRGTPGGSNYEDFGDMFNFHENSRSPVL